MAARAIGQLNVVRSSSSFICFRNPTSRPQGHILSAATQPSFDDASGSEVNSEYSSFAPQRGLNAKSFEVVKVVIGQHLYYLTTTSKQPAQPHQLDVIKLFLFVQGIATHLLSRQRHALKQQSRPCVACQPQPLLVIKPYSLVCTPGATPARKALNSSSVAITPLQH